MTARRFAQVDVFSSTPYGGNPVAVVLDADDLDETEMQRIARWTNLSETTFVHPVTAEGADYRVRIFTPAEELPFAGHPTLGTCHAWLDAAGRHLYEGEQVVQECAAGLVTIRQTPDGLSFAAPPLVRSGPVDDVLVSDLARQLGLVRDDVIDASWVDNGPGWVAVMLADADAVLRARPQGIDQMVGVIGACAADAPEAFEVRAFFPLGDGFAEDPVTGSLNASLAQWLFSTGRIKSPYVVRQGTALGRSGRVHLSSDGSNVWVGGQTLTLVSGIIDI